MIRCCTSRNFKLGDTFVFSLYTFIRPRNIIGPSWSVCEVIEKSKLLNLMDRH
jgi:hypothetical protein